jgi:hypothetical protein
VLPLLYLHGLSSGDFVPALEQFLGSAAGLSPAIVTRLTKQWQDDHAAFQQRAFAESDYVYVWADGVHPKIGLGQAHSCVLVLMGVRLDGTKELIARAGGCMSRPSRGPTCSGTAAAGACAIPSWSSVTARWACGRHQRRCSRAPGTSGAGSTRHGMPRTPCRNPHSQARRKQYRRSTTPRTARAEKAIDGVLVERQAAV